MKHIKEIIDNKYFRFLILLGILSILFNISLSFVVISGNSMHPYYENREIAFIDRLSYRFAPIKRFDIVIIKTKDGEMLIKRIIALPKESVSYENQNFYINKKILTSDFYNYHKNREMKIEAVRVPENHFFVIGDNRDYSLYSLFHKSQIVGKVIF